MSAVGAFRGSALGTAKTLPTGHSAVHIRLFGLPRTSTPADITRLLARNRVHNVTNAYRTRLPTLAQPSVLPKALAALQQVRFFGHPLTPRTTKPPSEPRMRSRGLKGREEASERSIVSGTGSQAGITDLGKSVLLSGLPGRISPEAMRRYLKNYSLMGGQGEVVKLESNLKASLTCRVLVRLSSASEAFRLLRNLHMTNYEPDAWGDRYIIRAQLIS
ncbi:hypothetical protein BJV77DRAFT_983706 [Russula vinacea]|nr:hypothetical protein BJV77DRAFT_983706 [Russula vinacea]